MLKKMQFDRKSYKICMIMITFALNSFTLYFLFIACRTRADNKGFREYPLYRF